jgi:hypothetical protein
MEASAFKDANEINESVYRIKLNRIKQTDLRSRFFHLDETLMNKIVKRSARFEKASTRWST